MAKIDKHTIATNNRAKQMTDDQGKQTIFEVAKHVNV